MLLEDVNAIGDGSCRATPPSSILEGSIRVLLFVDAVSHVTRFFVILRRVPTPENAIRVVVESRELSNQLTH